jgi:SAM-dependent methyltransferase
MSDAKYDAAGSAYDTTRRPDPRIAARLRAHLQPAPRGRYLDLACGTGNYTVSLAAAGVRLTGVDLSLAMLARARAKGAAVAWCQADVARLPFRDRCFDGALCTLAVHHFPALGPVFAEARRVLRAGRFVLFTALPEQMERYWLREYFPSALERSWAQMPSLDTLRAALEAAGFALAAVERWEVPSDLVDLFLYSGKHRPALYLDPAVRAGISTFAWLTGREELARGLARLQADLRSGAIHAVMARHAHGGGDYAFVVALARPR